MKLDHVTTDATRRSIPRTRPVVIRPVMPHPPESPLPPEAVIEERQRQETSRRLSDIRRRRGMAKTFYPVPFILLALLGYAVIHSPIQAALVLDSLPPPIIDATAPQVAELGPEIGAPTRPDLPNDPLVRASAPTALAVQYVTEATVSPWALATPQAVLTSLRPVLRPAPRPEGAPKPTVLVGRAPRANVEKPVAEAAEDAPAIPADVLARISAACDKPRLIATIKTERSGRSPLVEYRFTCDDDES